MTGEESSEKQGFKGSPVVGYVRSAKLGDPQLDEWEAEIRRYAAERGYNLVEVVRDEGVSGVAVWKPGLERVIRGVEQGRYVGAIIYNVTHLAESPSKVERTVATISKGAWVEILAQRPRLRT